MQFMNTLLLRHNWLTIEKGKFSVSVPPHLSDVLFQIRLEPGQTKSEPVLLKRCSDFRTALSINLFPSLSNNFNNLIKL